MRNVLAAHSQEVIQEFQQPLGLGILRRILGDAKEQRLRILLQHRQLIQESGVKHHVRAFLEWENISLLASPDRVPHADRILGGGTSGSGVPDHAAQKSSVCSRDLVVLVNIQLGQSADIDSKLTLLWKSVGQAVVQAVDSLYH